MQTIDVSGLGAGDGRVGDAETFDSGNQDVGTSGWVQVALLIVGGNRASMCLDLIVGDNALTNLMFTRAGFPGGTHVAIAGAAINTISADIPSALPANISTLAAASAGSVKLSGLHGVQEIGVWAMADTDTTVRVRGTVVDAR
jgi:hypothetical protein